MLYNNMKINRAYLEQKFITLPKGDKPGFGNAVMLLGSSYETDCSLINGNFLRYKESLYKKFYTDTIFREKIGSTTISETLTTVMTKYFKELNMLGISQVQQQSRVSTLGKVPNVIVSLGHWNDLFFKNRTMVSTDKMVENYFKFIGAKMSLTMFPGYKRTIYVPLDQWKQISGGVMRFTSKHMNDPVTMLMYAGYKNPGWLIDIGMDTEIVFCDSTTGAMFKTNVSTFSMTEGYATLKRLMGTVYGIAVDESEDPADKKNNNDTPVAIPSPADTKSTRLVEENGYYGDPSHTRKNLIAKQVKDNILKSVKVDNPKDITPDVQKIVDDDEFDEETDYDEDLSDIDVDENDIDTAISEVLDENPDLLDKDTSSDDAKDMLEDKVKTKLLSRKYMPDRTPEELKKLNLLLTQQKKVITTVDFNDAKSKVIDASSFEQVIDTPNTNITNSNFINFDKSYNDKKMAADIDAAVSIVSRGEYPLVVVDKQVTDSSDQLNLKETLTYTFKDEMDNEFTVNIDVPKIIDDKFIYVGGNKKIILKQRIPKPLTKIKPDKVVLSTFYNKIYMSRSTGNVDRNSTALKKFIMKNSDRLSVKFGNATVKNKGILTDLDFDFIGRNVTEFKYGKCTFMFDINECIKTLQSNGVDTSAYRFDKQMLVGYTTETFGSPKKEIRPIFIYRDDGQRLTEYVYELLSDQDKKEIAKIPIPKKSMYSIAKMSEKEIPLVLFMLYCDGFTRVMQKANIQYWIHEDKEELKNVNEARTGVLEFENGFISYERYPVENSLLLSGLDIMPLNMYKLEDLDTKDMYIQLLSMFYSQSQVAFVFDQFRDFMIDDVSKEVLIDFDMPTDLVELLVYANRWLATNEYKPIYDSSNLRVRSNECISYYVYKEITDAYINYRKKMYTGKPGDFYVKQDEAMKKMITDRLVEDASVLNPVLELEKNRSLTFRGPNGINMERAFNIRERAFDSSMVGLTGISTSPDALCGIVRQLTLEPNITSTRGYIQDTKPEDYDKLNSAQLFTPAELLSPPGVRRDDPQRTAILYVVAVKPCELREQTR